MTVWFPDGAEYLKVSSPVEDQASESSASPRLKARPVGSRRQEPDLKPQLFSLGPSTQK